MAEIVEASVNALPQQPLLPFLLQHPVLTTFVIVALILAFSFGAAYQKLPGNRTQCNIVRAALEQLTQHEAPDQCFGFIEEQEAKFCSERCFVPWGGRILDSGTGRYSLEWLHAIQQRTVEAGHQSAWTAITADDKMYSDLAAQFGLRTAHVGEKTKTALDVSLVPTPLGNKNAAAASSLPAAATNAGKAGGMRKRKKKAKKNQNKEDGKDDTQELGEEICDEGDENENPETKHEDDNKAQLTTTPSGAAGGMIEGESNRLVLGKWSNPDLLRGEAFDVVIADYLLGAVDGFEPYTQHKLFPRLKHVMKKGSRLYFVGMEPIPETSATHHGELIVSIQRLRDACIILGGGRAYREYPMSWVLDHLNLAGYRVIGMRTVPIRQNHEFVVRQINVGRRYIQHPKQKLSAASAATLQQLGKQLDEMQITVGKTNWTGVFYGHDYVIAAEPIF